MTYQTPNSQTPNSQTPNSQTRYARALWLTWRAAWTEAWSNQRGFWSQVGLMCINNTVFVIFWLVFFGEVRSLRGWDAERLMILLSIFSAVAGVVLGLLHNLRRIGNLVADGELDAALSLPIPPLVHLSLRRVEPVNVGDLFFGVGLFMIFGSPSPVRVALFLFGVVCGSAVLAGFFIIVGSLGFFAGRGDSADLGLQSILLFAHYPIDVFPGLMRLFLYAVIPAGFIGAVPARLMTDFDLGWAALTLLASATFLFIGVQSFKIGLRRYTSGSVWTTV